MNKNIYKYVGWYKTPLDFENFSILHKKNNIKGAIYTLVHILSLAITTVFCFYLHDKNTILFFLILLIHGSIYSFLGYAGASHELSHRTVFKKKIYNDFFFFLFSFLLWNNPIIFKKSHKTHHRCTLHEDCDGEIDHTGKINLSIILNGIFNYNALKNKIYYHFFNSFGVIKGAWVNNLAIKKENKTDEIYLKRIRTWSLFLIFGHLFLTLFFMHYEMYVLILLITFGSFFGNLPVIVLSMSQHNLMPTNKSDFRENSRTVVINPIFEFFYWNMNYHIEHSMYPAVPFYNLKKLHKLIKKDTPKPIKGFLNIYKNLKA